MRALERSLEHVRRNVEAITEAQLRGPSNERLGLLQKDSADRYPYIRETITGLVVKAALPQLFVPILNFATVFYSQEVDLNSFPEPPAETPKPAGSVD